MAIHGSTCNAQKQIIIRLLKVKLTSQFNTLKQCMFNTTEMNLRQKKC